MIFRTVFLSAALLAAGISSGFAKTLKTRATISVTVGGEAGLVFDPEWVDASAGDVVTFDLLSASHSVTQSTFDQPCVFMEGGADSGILPNPQSVPGQEVFEFTVTDSEPQWFFCAQVGHCLQGMVFAINPGSEEKFNQFKDIAMGVAAPTSAESTESMSSAPTESASGSMSASATGSMSAAPTESATGSMNATATGSMSATPTESATGTMSATPTKSAVSYTGAASIDNVPRGALAGLVGAAGLALALF